MYQIITEGKFKLFNKKTSKSSKFYHVENSFYPSITDFLEAMNTLIQERHNHSESCITSEVSRIMQKVGIYLAKEGAGLSFLSMNLEHIFRSNVGNELGRMLRGQRTSQTRNCFRHCPDTLSHDIHGSD